MQIAAFLVPIHHFRRCWSYDQQLVPLLSQHSLLTIHCSPIPSFKFTPFASTAGGLRNCNAAAFAPFLIPIVSGLNTDSVGTEPEEAAYEITVENAHNGPRILINIQLSDIGRIIDT